MFLSTAGVRHRFKMPTASTRRAAALSPVSTSFNSSVYCGAILKVFQCGAQDQCQSPRWDCNRQNFDILILCKNSYLVLCLGYCKENELRFQLVYCEKLQRKWDVGFHHQALNRFFDGYWKLKKILFLRFWLWTNMA